MNKARISKREISNSQGTQSYMRSLTRRDVESKRREDTKRKKDLESRLLDPSLTNKKKRAHIQKELSGLLQSNAANEKSGKKPSLRGGGKRLARVSCSPSYGESDSDPDYSSDDDCYGTSRDDDYTDPCPLKDEWRTLEDGLCGQRTFLHQSGIKKFVHGGKEYTLPNTIDIRSDSSRDTLEFLAALTMSVFEFGLDERCILADFIRLHKLWKRNRPAVVRGDRIDSSLWVDDTWLMYAGMKFELRVKISLLIDNVFKEDRQYNPFAESVRVVEMTCNARGCTDSDDFVP